MMSRRPLGAGPFAFAPRYLTGDPRSLLLLSNTLLIIGCRLDSLALLRASPCLCPRVHLILIIGSGAPQVGGVASRAASKLNSRCSSRGRRRAKASSIAALCSSDISSRQPPATPLRKCPLRPAWLLCIAFIASKRLPATTLRNEEAHSQEHWPSLEQTIVCKAD